MDSPYKQTVQTSPFVCSVGCVAYPQHSLMILDPFCQGVHEARSEVSLLLPKNTKVDLSPDGKLD